MVLGRRGCTILMQRSATTMPDPWLLGQTRQHLMPGECFARFTSVYATPGGPGQGKWQAEAPDVAPEQAAPEVGQPVVLIADDEESIAESLALIAEDAGFTTIMARNGRDALALARQHRPQLIITDLMMPYLSGTDLIATLRRDAAEHDTTPPLVIVVTAASSARAEEAGADAIVTKPFDVTTIEAAIHRLVPGDHDGAT